MDIMGLSTKSDVLVFFANAIDTKGGDGSQIRGCTIHYVFLNTIAAAQSEYDVTKPVGMQRGKSWCDYEMRNKVRIAPAIYEGTFEMAVGSDGRPTLRLIDIAYKSNVEFVPYRLPGLDLPGMVPSDAPSSEAVREALKTLKKPAAENEGKPESGEKSAEPDSKPGEKSAEPDSKPGEKSAEPDSKPGKKGV